MLYHPLMTGGRLLLMLFLLPSLGRSEYLPPPGCPPLPEQGSANTVSVYVAKALDVPGVVCVRRINGFSTSVRYSRLWLQEWDNGRLWGLWGAGFRDFPPERQEPQIIVGLAIGATWEAASTVSDVRFPLPSPSIPTGRYRVCVTYDFYDLPKEESHDACSEEVSFP